MVHAGRAPFLFLKGEQMGKRQAFVDFVVDWCEDPSHGYTQDLVKRWGPDCDCSSLMYMAANAAGYDVPTGYGNTATMKSDFEKAGWTAVPFDGVLSDCAPGCIALNTSNHTEAFVDWNTFGGASMDENGGIQGATSGDQTGREVRITGAYTPSYGWDYILIPPDEDGSGSAEDSSDLFVIDVSEHQGQMDWDSVAPYIDGAIIRCGYGSDIESQDDKQFSRNVSECERLGIPYGVYLYSYAADDSMANSEADHLLRLLPEPSRLSFPVYLDVEERGLMSYFKRACEVVGPKIEAAGYWFGFYAGRSDANQCDLKSLPYTAWIAEYGVSTLGYDGNADMWQYSSTETVGGVYPLDANYCYRNFPLEIRGESYSRPESSGQSGSTSQGSTTYAVMSGDTLSGIASKFGVSYQSIAAASGLSDPNVIYPGQVLTIPSSNRASSSGKTHTVASGETLSGIASKYGTTYQEIASLNGLGDPNVIYPGQVLLIP